MGQTLRQFGFSFIFFLFYVFCFAAEEQNQSAKYLDNPEKLLATVNSHKIYLKDILDRYKRSIVQMSEKGVTPSQAIHDFMLQGLISQKIEELLLIDAAKEKKLAVDFDEVNQIIEKFKSKFDSDEKMKDYLAKQKLSIDDVREKIEERFMVKQYQEDILFKDIQVTDENIKEFYERNMDIYQPKHSYKISQIFIPYQETYSEIEKEYHRETMSSVHDKILKGESFEEMAKTHSKGATAVNGGLIGWISENKPLDPQIMDVIKTMKAGDVSKIIETQNGLHLMKLNEIKEPKAHQSLTEVKDQIKDQLMLMNKREILRQFIGKAQKDSKIEIYPLEG